MLDKLKRRLGMEGTDKDELLAELIEDATQFVLSYTGRQTLPTPLQGAVCEIAAGSYNLLGLEGSTSHSEGGVSDSIQPISEKVTEQLKPWRVARVG